MTRDGFDVTLSGFFVESSSIRYVTNDTRLPIPESCNACNLVGTFELTVAPAVTVPESSTISLVAIGMLVLGMFGRNARSRFD